MSKSAPSPRRAELLSANWHLLNDPVWPFFGPCHFFTREEAVRPTPRALCGAAPTAEEQVAWQLSFTTAAYSPSKADCRDCCRAIGE